MPPTGGVKIQPKCFPRLHLLRIGVKDVGRSASSIDGREIVKAGGLDGILWRNAAPQDKKEPVLFPGPGRLSIGADNRFCDSAPSAHRGEVSTPSIGSYREMAGQRADG